MATPTRRHCSLPDKNQLRRILMFTRSPWVHAPRACDFTAVRKSSLARRFSPTIGETIVNEDLKKIMKSSVGKTINPVELVPND